MRKGRYTGNHRGQGHQPDRLEPGADSVSMHIQLVAITVCGKGMADTPRCARGHCIGQLGQGRALLAQLSMGLFLPRLRSTDTSVAVRRQGLLTVAHVVLLIS